MSLARVAEAVVAFVVAIAAEGAERCGRGSSAISSRAGQTRASAKVKVANTRTADIVVTSCAVRSGTSGAGNSSQIVPTITSSASTDITNNRSICGTARKHTGHTGSRIEFIPSVALRAVAIDV